LVNLSLPLVSVIINNYNYGRFLAEAARSVVAQTYKNIECVIVDDASTDDSAAVLAEIERDYPAIKIVRRNANGGQWRAFLDGFRHSLGSYVIALDSDDVMLPHCIEFHVWAHLSSRRPVGFSSGDLLQQADGQIVTTTDTALSRYVQSMQGRRSQDFIRPVELACPNLWPYSTGDFGLQDKLYYTPPPQVDWVWSSTSGSCFRRDAVNLLVDCEGLDMQRWAVDDLLYIAIGALTGSLVIDIPLGVYRIHGANRFTKHLPLEALQNFDAGGSEQTAAAAAVLLRHLFQHSERFGARAGNPSRFIVVAHALAAKAGGRASLHREFAKNYEAVAGAIGREAARSWRQRMAYGRLGASILRTLDSLRAGA
jgi:glycosyltransferase involved in cell wall biosynthesis